MNTNLILDYLSDLEKNNNKEWFGQHKAEYKAANEEFLSFVDALIFEIGKTDPSILHNEAKNLTFKLQRDTRFSKDKSPYNPSFRAHIGPAGKLPVPVGYYIMISPGGKTFLGGGLFADMFKDATDQIRSYIAAHGTEWETIIHAPAFERHFKVMGNALKNVPKDYDKNHPQAEYLKNKSWFLESHIPDDLVRDSETFFNLAVEQFLAMKDFNDFLNRALKDFKMPEHP